MNDKLKSFLGDIQHLQDLNVETLDNLPLKYMEVLFQELLYLREEVERMKSLTLPWTDAKAAEGNATAAACIDRVARTMGWSPEECNATPWDWICDEVYKQKSRINACHKMLNKFVQDPDFGPGSVFGKMLRALEGKP